MKTEEIKTEKRTGIIIFLLGLLFLFIACECTAQCIERGHKIVCNKEIITYRRCGVLKLHELRDSIAKTETNIRLDSISSSEQIVIVRQKYPYYDTLSVPELQIGLTNGDFVTLTPTFIEKSINTVEFVLTKEQCIILKTYKFDYMAVASKQGIRPWINIDEKDYFMYFLNNWDKHIDVENITRINSNF